MEPWPQTSQELEAVQRQLAVRTPELWRPSGPVRSVGGCFVCFAKGGMGMGASGDPGWAAAVWMLDGTLTSVPTPRLLQPLS